MNIKGFLKTAVLPAALLAMTVTSAAADEKFSLSSTIQIP